MNWFPGHMAKAARSVENKIRAADVILEVRDARVRLPTLPRRIPALAYTLRWRRRVCRLGGEFGQSVSAAMAVVVVETAGRLCVPSAALRDVAMCLATWLYDCMAYLMR